MQAALEDLAARYPAAFGGYRLRVVESHQKTKADTSGTAKAVIDSIKVLANDPDYSYDDVEMIRDDEEAVRFGVPKDAVKGHAFHTVRFRSIGFNNAFIMLSCSVSSDRWIHPISFAASILHLLHSHRCLFCSKPPPLHSHRCLFCFKPPPVHPHVARRERAVPAAAQRGRPRCLRRGDGGRGPVPRAQAADRPTPTVYSMINVLEEGALE